MSRGSNLVASDGEPPSDPDRSSSASRLSNSTTRSSPTSARRQASRWELSPSAPASGPARPDRRLRLCRPVAVGGRVARRSPAITGRGGVDQLGGGSGRLQPDVPALGCYPRHGGGPTDGYPEGPAGGPAQQLAAIAPMAHTLWANGIAIQPLLYGAGAGMQGPARQAVTQLATLGHGQLVLQRPWTCCGVRCIWHRLPPGCPWAVPRCRSTAALSVPLDLPARVARAVLVVLRSSDQVEVSIAAPDGTTLSSLAAGTGGPGLVIGASPQQEPTRPALRAGDRCSRLSWSAPTQ